MRDAALQPPKAERPPEAAQTPPVKPITPQPPPLHLLRRLAREGAVLLLMILLALAITWPWAAHPRTTIIALTDPQTGTASIDSVINMSFGGWMTFAPLELHRWPFAWTPWLAWPDGASHATSYDSPLAGLFTGFLYLFLPLGVAYSVMHLLAFVLCGYVCYRLALGRWRSFALALAIGLTAECCPFLYQRTLGHANLMHIWVLPLAIGLFERWRKAAARRIPPARRTWIAWGLSFPLMALSSWYLFLIGMIYQGIASIIFAWRRSASPRHKERIRSSLRQLALAWGLGLGLTMLLAVPMALGYRNRERVPLETLAQYSTPLAQYLMPFPDSPLGQWPPVARLQQRLGTHWEAYTGIPLACLIFFILFLLRGGRRRAEERLVYGLTAIVAIYVSLGPFLHLARAVPPGAGLPLPTYYLARLSGIFSLFKVPGRVHLLVFFLALLAAGQVLARWRAGWLAQQQRGRWRRMAWPALLAAFFALNLAWSVPLGRGLVAPLPPVPTFYRELGRQPGRGAVLDAPFDNYYTPLYSYYQLWHKRPIIGATLYHDGIQWRSRRYVNQRPGVCFFRTYNEQWANWWVAGLVCQPAFMQDLAQHGIAYVVIHPAYVDLLTRDGQLAPRTAELYARFESAWHDRLVYQDGLIRVYATRPKP